MMALAKRQDKDIVSIQLHYLLFLMSKTPFKKTEDQWREILDDESYRVMREKGTEYPHTASEKIF